MKIEFLTQEDPLYILPFFEEFLRHYAGKFRSRASPAAAPWASDRAGGCCGSSNGCTALPDWASCCSGGQREGALLVAARTLGFALLFHRPAGKGVRHSYERVANPNRPEFTGGLRERSPDLLISVACPYILKEKVLAVPARGCINIHHAPLPRYKGMMPTFWQLFHGERQLGVTIHYIGGQGDEGDALLQESLPVAPGDSLHELIRRSKRHGAH